MTINTTTKTDLINSRFAKEKKINRPRMQALSAIEERNRLEAIPKEGVAYYDQLEKELAA